MNTKANKMLQKRSCGMIPQSVRKTNIKQKTDVHSKPTLISEQTKLETESLLLKFFLALSPTFNIEALFSNPY